VIPTIEAKVPGEFPQVIKESLSGRQVRPQQSILLIGQFQQRME
jgi:hypothetical protein